MLKLNKNHKHQFFSLTRYLLVAALFAVGLGVASLGLGGEVSAQVCYGEGGTTGPTITCSGAGAEDLVADKCYIRIDGGGDGYYFEETTCPAGVGAGLEYTPPPDVTGDDSCGGGDGAVSIAVDVGCADEGNPITAYANAIINFLAAGVGIVVITMVATGGVQYMTAGGNPQGTQAAIKRISDAFIGLLFFIFLWAFLQWIIPGGLL